MNYVYWIEERKLAGGCCVYLPRKVIYGRYNVNIVPLTKRSYSTYAQAQEYIKKVEQSTPRWIRRQCLGETFNPIWNINDMKYIPL